MSSDQMAHNASIGLTTYNRLDGWRGYRGQGFGYMSNQDPEAANLGSRLPSRSLSIKAGQDQWLLAIAVR